MGCSGGSQAPCPLDRHWSLSPSRSASPGCDCGVTSCGGAIKNAKIRVRDSAERRIAADGDERVPLPKLRLSLLTPFQLTGPEGHIGLPNKKLAGLLAPCFFSWGCENARNAQGISVQILLAQ
jgi:hypothetical protein